MRTSITIQDTTAKRLRKLKLYRDFVNMDSVILYLLKVEKLANGTRKDNS